MTEESKETLSYMMYLSYWAPTCLMVGRDAAPWSSQPESEKLAWRSVATEVIRQMEWTRKMADNIPVSQVILTDGTHRNVENLPLTLAPEDWKP